MLAEPARLMEDRVDWSRYWAGVKFPQLGSGHCARKWSRFTHKAEYLLIAGTKFDSVELRVGWGCCSIFTALPSL